MMFSAALKRLIGSKMEETKKTRFEDLDLDLKIYDIDSFLDWMDMTKVDIRLGIIAMVDPLASSVDIMRYEPTDEECKKMIPYVILESVEINCKLCEKQCKKVIEHDPLLVKWIGENKLRQALADLMAVAMVMHFKDEESKPGDI
jgi:hypothetical protein